MTPEDNESLDPEQQQSVWSDLRAMRLLSHAQKDIRGLRSAQARLQVFLILSTTVLGVGLIVVATVLAITYAQLQRVQPLPNAPTSEESSR